MNGHGIAYPLMFAIVGAYLTESVVRRIVDRTSWTRQERAYAFWGLVAMAMFIVTPLGIRVIPVPFRSLEVISQFILELRSVDPFSLLQWSIGPEFMVGMLRDWGALGVLLTHQWDVASTSSSAADINITGGQYFYTYLLDGGWAIGAGPTFSYDWEADSDNSLTLPLGIGINRTVLLGSTPWKFALEGNYYLESPDAFGQDWSLRLSFTPVVPLPW